MKLSFEIYTTKVAECKQFYTQYFDFVVKLEIEGFVILKHKYKPEYELMFCIPNSPFVNSIFHPAFNGEGAILQLEVDNVLDEYKRIKELKIPIALDIVREPINGHHFTIQDPSGLLIDIVEFN